MNPADNIVLNTLEMDTAGEKASKSASAAPVLSQTGASTSGGTTATAEGNNTVVDYMDAQSIMEDDPLQSRLLELESELVVIYEQRGVDIYLTHNRAASVSEIAEILYYIHAHTYLMLL